MPTSPEPPRYLAIFDHDGVLVDSLAHHQDAWVELGRRAELPITAELIRGTFGMANPSIFRALLGRDLPPDEVARHTELKEACYRELAEGKVELIAGVAGLIDRLEAGGFALAVGTSGVRANVELTVRSCGLDGRFRAISSYEDFTHGKPDPEVFLVAARKAGFDPGRCVVFEDAVVGVQAARAAGMVAVGVTTTFPTQALRDAGAFEVFDSLADVDVEALRRAIDAPRAEG